MSATDSPSDVPDPETRAGIYRATYESFPAFVDIVFADSFERFVRGEWVARRCRHLQAHDKSVVVGPRDHFKSTGNYAYVCWHVWRNRFDADPDVEWADGPTDLEILYFSFNLPMARYHIGSENKDGIKKLIDRNPWFEPISDHKKRADSRAEYAWNDHGTVSLSPASVQQMVRGRHTDMAIVDDPFQDDNKKDVGLDPGLVLKINRIFKDAIMDIPTGPMAELHVTTTPQTDEDFTFDDQLLADYGRIEEPAIQDYDREAVLWPEWKDYDELIGIKQKRGAKSFNQEYQISPRSSEIGYFRDESVAAMTVSGLTDYGEDGLRDRWVANEDEWTFNGCVAGLDIGKKRHPAHLAVFALLDREIHVHRDDGDDVSVRSPAGHLFQVHSKWMDGWDYTRQVEYCQRAVEYFGIRSLPYDNTRGEYEGLEEIGKLPGAMTPVSLNRPTNQEVASAFDVHASAGRIKLLGDGRQNRQLKVVTNDLDAVETSEGHGESFWSIALACHAASAITRQAAATKEQDSDSTGVSYL